MNNKPRQIFIENQERKISYYISGNSESRNALFFLNGLYHGNDVWIKQQRYPFFANGYRLIFMDYRGLGKSEEKNAICAYTFDDVADDILSIINKEHIDKINLVGYSIGGMMAIYFAYKFQSRVEKMILLNTTASENLRTSKIMAGVIKLIDENASSNSIFSTVYPMNHSNWYLDKVADFENVVLKKYIEYNRNREAFKYLLLSIKNRPDLEKAIDSIDFPMIVFSGDKDYVYPIEFQERIVRGKNGREHFIIKNCGHASFIEKYDEINSLIENFLSENN